MYAVVVLLVYGYYFYMDNHDMSYNIYKWVCISSLGLISLDFFDSGLEPSGSGDGDQEKPETAPDKKMSDVLPEGFFDDPKMDAKVR